MAQMREAVSLVVSSFQMLQPLQPWPHSRSPAFPRVFPPPLHQVQERHSGQEAWGPLLAQQSSGPPKLSAPPWPAEWWPHFPGGLGSPWETLGFPLGPATESWNGPSGDGDRGSSSPCWLGTDSWASFLCYFINIFTR